MPRRLARPVAVRMGGSSASTCGLPRYSTVQYSTVQYMRATQGFLGNTTFHGISWVLEEVSAWAKLAIVAYFTFMFICALYSVITAVSR